MNIQTTIDDYIKHLEEEGKPQNTVQTYRIALGTFSKWIATSWEQIEDVEGITPTIVRDYREYLLNRYTPATINNKLTLFRHYLRYVQDEGVQFVDNPIESIRLKAVAIQNTTKTVDERDIMKIYYAIDMMNGSYEKKIKHRAILAIFLNCGLRLGELVNLKKSDIGESVIHIQAGKGDKYRVVPLGKKTKEAIDMWLSVHKGGEYLFYSQRSDKMTERAVQHIMKKLGSLAGITFNSHQFRHTYGKRLADETQKIEVVASLMGHSNIQTTRRYIEPSMKEMTEFVNKIEV